VELTFTIAIPKILRAKTKAVTSDFFTIYIARSTLNPHLNKNFGSLLYLKKGMPNWLEASNNY
jgi:hypothetical protein